MTRSATDTFARIARWASVQSGKASTFIAACAVVILWAATGPIFHYSDTWQLVINTGTTIITFLMVFLLQNAQNRDGVAIQLKLDELIRTNKDARNKLLALEDLTEAELEQMKTAFEAMAKQSNDARVREKLTRATDRLKEATDHNPASASAAIGKLDASNDEQSEINHL